METRIGKYTGRLFAISLLLFLGFSQAHAQKNLISDQEEVIQAAAKVMETAMKEGSLLELKNEHKLTGSYILDVTIRNKGEVVSIFVVERDGGSIEFQNLLKDHIKSMKMGFRMPKNKNYKFRYKFNFDE
ncbi:MAG: hypothetical protein KDD36_13165 [Flavobacteriales bacterium]|nr:hypothetical protein [Flavobacteriales bacterium]